MIDIITTYKTNDGKIHESREKAVKYLENELQIYINEIIKKAMAKDSYATMNHRALVALVCELAGTIDNAREFVSGIFDIVGTFEYTKEEEEE